jgi:hypothetical protein
MRFFINGVDRPPLTEPLSNSSCLLYPLVFVKAWLGLSWFFLSTPESPILVCTCRNLSLTTYLIDLLFTICIPGLRSAKVRGILGVAREAELIL